MTLSGQRREDLEPPGAERLGGAISRLTGRVDYGHGERLDRLREPLRAVRVRRKLTEKQSVAGSIPPDGQRVTIRVVVDRWLRVQRMYHYKIGVVSLDSPYCGNVDDFSSELMLNAGHAYDVRLNDNPKNPRIKDLYGEVLGEAS